MVQIEELLQRLEATTSTRRTEIQDGGAAITWHYNNLEATKAEEEASETAACWAPPP